MIEFIKPSDNKISIELTDADAENLAESLALAAKVAQSFEPFELAAHDFKTLGEAVEGLRKNGSQYVLSEKEYTHPFLNVNVPMKPSVEEFVNVIWEIKTRHNKLETEAFVNFADINKKIRYIAYAAFLNGFALCLYGVSYIIEWFK